MNLDFFKGKLLHKQWIIDFTAILIAKESDTKFDDLKSEKNDFVNWLNQSKEKYIQEIDFVEIEENFNNILTISESILQSEDKNVNDLAVNSNRIITLLNQLDNKYNNLIPYNSAEHNDDMLLSEEKLSKDKPLVKTFLGIHESESTETQIAWNEFLNKAEHKFKKKKK